MSYYTRVTFEFSDAPPDIDEIASAARSWLTDQELYAVDDVLEDLLRAWTDGETDFTDLRSEDFEGLMTFLSSRHPGIRFYIRGMGEDYFDVWLRQFQDGQTVFTMGPIEPPAE